MTWFADSDLDKITRKADDGPEVLWSLDVRRDKTGKCSDLLVTYQEKGSREPADATRLVGWSPGQPFAVRRETSKSLLIAIYATGAKVGTDEPIKVWRVQVKRTTGIPIPKMPR